MRVREQDGGLTVQAIAGANTVLLGIDIDESRRDGLLGFGLHRTDHTEDEAYWLRGMKTFAATVPAPAPGQTYSMRDQPLQGFQWGDYSAKPGHEYTYRVVELEGKPGNLTERHAVAVRVTTEVNDDGVHGIWFNRGVAASQAFAAKFPNLPDDSPDLSGARWAWLSRGLGEAFVAFVRRAEGPGWGLRGALYEFTWAAGLAEFAAAAARGADVRLVVHGRDKDRPDASGDANKDRTAEKSRAAAEIAGITALITWRTAPNKGALQHNKFLVLTKDGDPVAVWTGSTNLTEGAVFGHSNVGHSITDPATAAAFLAYWDQIEQDSQTTAALRAWTGERNPVDTATTQIPPGIRVVFSPRVGLTLLDWYADLMRSAASSAHISGAFGLNKVFHAVLDEDRDIVRTVLLDKQVARNPVEPTDPDVRISVGAALERPVANWAKETLTGFNGHVPFVHTKIILVDPLTDAPLTLTGSANYSDASTNEGEEHTLVISGDTRVADIYLTEYHRIFMHFPFRRWFNAAVARDAAAMPRPLTADDGWSTQYWTVKWRARQRALFAGSAPGG